MRPSLPAAVAAGEQIVLDGGLATLLETHGHDLTSALWSARLLADDPAAITAAHREYFAAGAQVATTASYQASFEGLAAAGYDRAQATALLRRSCQVAVQAREQADSSDGQSTDAAGSGAGVGSRRWIAASVGPYGAALADGSEYRGDYGLSVAELRAWHRPRLQVLMQAVSDGLADVLAVETIPCAAEAEAVLAEVSGSGIPMWLSLTANGDLTRLGEPLADVFAQARGVAEVFAAGVNCCPAGNVADQIEVARQASGLPAVVYPNSGEVWDAQRRRWRGSPTFDPAMLRRWQTAGAQLIGGCCRVGPAVISAIAAA